MPHSLALLCRTASACPLGVFRDTRGQVSCGNCRVSSESYAPRLHFKHKPSYQEAILKPFQASKWSRFVVVELPRQEGVNPTERLCVTTKNLNRVCGRRIKFTQEGMAAASTGRRSIELHRMYPNATSLVSLIYGAKASTMTVACHSSLR